MADEFDLEGAKDFLSRFAKATGSSADAIEGIGKAARYSQSGLTNWNSSMKQSKEGLIDWGASVDKSSKSAKGFAGTISSSAKKLESSLRGLMSGEGSLEGFVGAVGSSAGKVVSSLGGLAGSIGSIVPGIGDALDGLGKTAGALGEGALVAATGIFAGAMGFAGRIVDLNKQIMSSGMGMAEGMDGIMDAATKANVDLKSFSTAIMENRESLRMMAGGAPGGIKAVSKAFKEMGPTIQAQLLGMGLTQEEILGGISEVAATAQMTGQAIDAKGLATSSEKYLKIQMELARLTGVDVKTAKQKAQVELDNLRVQKLLRNALPEQRAAYLDLLGSVDETTRSLIINGQAIDETTGMLQTQMPAYSDAMIRAGANILDPTKTTGEALKTLANDLSSDKVIKDRNRVQDVFGGISVNGSAAAQQLGIAATTVTKLHESAKTYGDNMLTEAAKNNAAITSFETMNLKFQAMMFFVGSQLFSLFGGGTGSMAKLMTLSLEEIQTGTQLFAAKINDNNPDPFQSDAAKAWNKWVGTTGADIGDLMGEAKDGMGGIWQKLKDTFEELKKLIPESIAAGFSQVMKELNPAAYSNREASAFENSPEFAAITEKLKDKVDPGEYVGSALTWDETNKLQMFIDSFTDIQQKNDALLRLGLDQRKTTLFGMDTGVSELYKANPKPQAHGDAWSPKAGGQIVKVAEAGFHEATMPLARVGGDMGVKVTGDMIDGSRTMPAMLAAINNLNTQIASLRSLAMEQNRIMDKQTSVARTNTYLAG